MERRLHNSAICPPGQGLIVLSLSALCAFTLLRGSAASVLPSAEPQVKFAQLPPQSTEPENNTIDKQKDKNDLWMSPEVEKRKLQLMLVTGIVIISGFFIAILLMSLLRMSRHRRRLLFRKKQQPTEYSDAWSQYRLQDGWEKDLPDDLDKIEN